MPFRSRSRLLVAATALVGASIVAPCAFAQQLRLAPLDLQVFRPAMDSKGYITLNSSQVLGPKDFSFGLVSTWGAKVLDFTNPNIAVPMGSDPARFAVANIITPSLQGAVGVFSYGHFGVEIGVVLPMTILSGRGYPSDLGSPANPNDDDDFTLSRQGLGDLVVHPKIRLLNAGRNRLGIAVIPSVVLPTGSDEAFLGEGQVIFQPTGVIDAELGYLGRFRIAVNGGMRIRGKESVFIDDGAMYTAPRTLTGAGMVNTGYGLRVKNEALAGLGLSFGVVPQKFDIVGEVYGMFGLGAKRIEAGVEQKLAPVIEAVGGIKLYLARNSFFLAGGGWRLASDSYGAGAPRAFVGFIFEPSIGDRDGDGYKDDVDKCPDDPEDFDDFEDADGCPDPDNDRDLILDEDDKCPNDPETRNGFQDEDGCPDSTTNDRDGDKIPDDVDKCPDDPEDYDKFEDEDGCPDPDNDKDGILDVNDLCPNDPEDKDGFEDADGCPDPDNDKDRILDGNDKCPNEPETYNGFEDDDGCPDKGKVIVTQRKLEILDKIYFETDKDEIKPISFPLLDAIAATIKGYPQIQLIEIQGHADERGDDAHNLDLTERRAAAVKRALYERNVEPGRLRSKGYGETRPVCTKHNEDCWSQNRRSEFIIIKRADEAHFQGGEGQ